jgi:hypothetical protein
LSGKKLSILVSSLLIGQLVCFLIGGLLGEITMKILFTRFLFTRANMSGFFL